MVKKTGKKDGRTQARAKNKTRQLERARVHVSASFNNTIITLTDPDGDPVTWKSPGVVGYKGSRKGNAYAAQVATEALMRDMRDYGVRSVFVTVKGTGSGRQAVVQTLKGSSIRVEGVKNITPVSHSKRKKGKK